MKGPLLIYLLHQFKLNMPYIKTFFLVYELNSKAIPELHFGIKSKQAKQMVITCSM